MTWARLELLDHPPPGGPFEMVIEVVVYDPSATPSGGVGEVAFQVTNTNGIGLGSYSTVAGNFVRPRWSPNSRPTTRI